MKREDLLEIVLVLCVGAAIVAFIVTLALNEFGR